jgi:transcriptional regulator with XRE-family HTH domain
MTAHPHLEQLIGTFAGWLTHRRELNELHQIDRTELDRIAGDLQVSPSALEELVEKGPYAADELERLLKALGIDEAALARTQPTVLRDASAPCASTSANAIRTSRPARPPSATRPIVRMRRRSPSSKTGRP